MHDENWLKRNKLNLAINVVLVFLAFNFINSIEKKGVILTFNHILYYAFHICALTILFYNLYKDYNSDDSYLKYVIARLKKLSIPKPLKIITLIIFVGQLVYITLGATRYPFSYVGMFSWSIDFKDEPTEVVIPKYYYYKDGQPEIVEIRKQHLFFMADLLGWGYNNELTFSMNYHYKGKKENFEFLLDRLENIDTLWVGLQTVDYETGEVSFEPDIYQATAYNDTASNIYYGPIYIPEYQRIKYEQNE